MKRIGLVEVGEAIAVNPIRRDDSCAVCNQPTGQR
jgi:hypothetical protein